MPAFLTSGAKTYIGGVKTPTGEDYIVSDFSGETWVEITGIESMGSLGDTANTTVLQFAGPVRDLTLKGTRSAGSMELVAAIDYADAGQIALIAAEKSNSNFAFKVELNDAPSGGTPSERYFVGLVTSAVETFDGANSVMKMNTSIAIQSNVVRVAAAA